MWKSTVKFLDRHFVDQQQYLVIKHKDGRREHVRGPKALFEDPVLHDGITVHNGLHVNNYEVIVVYRYFGPFILQASPPSSSLTIFFGGFVIGRRPRIR